MAKAKKTENKEQQELIQPTVTDVVQTDLAEEKPKETVLDEFLEAEYKERIPKQPENEKSNEEKLLSFIQKSTNSLVRLNDFLKSLYPSEKPFEPPVWKKQITSRQIRLMLSIMQNKGDLKIFNNTHIQLGDCYFDSEGKTKHFDLDTLIISAEK